MLLPHKRAHLIQQSENVYENHIYTSQAERTAFNSSSKLGRIILEFPTGGTEHGMDAVGQRWLQSFLHPVAAGFHQGFEAELCLEPGRARRPRRSPTSVCPR